MRFEICLDPRQTAGAVGARPERRSPPPAAVQPAGGGPGDVLRSSSERHDRRSSPLVPALASSAALTPFLARRCRPPTSCEPAAGRLPPRGSTWSGGAAPAPDRPGSASSAGASVEAQRGVRLAPPGAFVQDHQHRAAHRDLEPWLCQKFPPRAESNSVSQSVSHFAASPFGCQPAPSRSPPGATPSLTSAEALCWPVADESGAAV